MKAMQKKLNNGKTVKITASGYLYIDGEKKDERGINPLYIPRDHGDAVTSLIERWVANNWEMVNN